MRDQSIGTSWNAVRAGLLELDPDPLAQLRIAQSGDRRGGASGVHPAGEVGVEVRRAGEVRVRVQRDVDPVGAGLVDHREQLRRATPVDGEAEVGVRVVERHTRRGARSSMQSRYPSRAVIP